MKKNVLLIVPTLQAGGQEKVAALTYDLLSKDYHLWLLIFEDTKQVYYPKHRVVNIHVPAAKNRLVQFFHLCKRIVLVKRFKRQQKIDLSYSFGSTANLVNCMSKATGKTIVSIRGSQSFFKRSISNYVKQKKADGFVCVSKELEAKLIKKGIGQEKVHAIYNPYDINEIQKLGMEPVGFGFEYIVTCGRLEHVKGYQHLLKAFKLVHKKYKNLHLVIVGDGSLWDSLHMLADTLGLAKYVHFTGFQGNPYKYMRRAEAYILTSISEGFPNALVEAMASGCPVVAADCVTGPREILGGKGAARKKQVIEEAANGFLVPPFLSDVSEEKEKEQILAQAICRLLACDAATRDIYRENSFSIAHRFSNEVYRKNLIDLFEEAICSNGG